MYRPRTIWEWALLSMVVLQAIIMIILEGLLLVGYRRLVEPIVSGAEPATISVTIGLVVFDCFGQIALAIDGLRSKNNIQLFTLCLCNGCVFLITFLEYMQIHEIVLTASMELAKPESPAGLGGDIWKSLQPVMLASFVCVGACSIGLAFITYYLHQVFAWAIYKRISADVDVRRRHLQYQLYLVTAKLCLFSSVGFLFIYGFVELRPAQPEFAVTMLLVPVAVLKPIVSVYFIKHEVTSGAMTIIALYIAQTAYLLSRVVIVVGKSEQSAADDAIIFFATAALFCTILTLATVIQCLRNFDHGLKPFLLARQDQGEGQRTGTSWELSQSELHLVRRFSMD